MVFGITTVHYYGTDVNLWFHTLFLLGDIAIGALFAFISFRRNWGFDWLEKLGKKAIIGIYAMFLLSFLFYHNLFDNSILPGALNLIIEKLFYAFVLSYFIFEQNFGKNSFYKFGKLKTITYLGVISYGLFCFHEIGLLIGNQLLTWTGLESNIWAFLMLKPLIAFAIITPFAHLSWNYFEKPILSLKHRFYAKKR